jgi:hypothetical protein
MKNKIKDFMQISSGILTLLVVLGAVGVVTTLPVIA